MNKIKKTFSQPKIEIVTFLSEDILVISGLPSIPEEDSKSDNTDPNGWL